MAPSMKILASWKQQRVERRAKQRAKARSDEIDRQLREESKHCAIGQRQQHDILLIGTPGSEAEAFAIVKHMKIIHDDCLSEQLLVEFRSVIWNTLLENARDIVLVLRRLNLEYTNCSTKAHCEYIMNHRRDTDNPEFLFLPDFAQVVQDLWTEEAIPLLLDCPSAFPLADNAEYFFAEAQRITAEDYVPSIEDIGHSTSEQGVMETHFDINQLSLRVLQVYGQQCWRRKWMCLFEGVTSVMFCASLSDYDEPPSGASLSVPDPRTRLVECLTLYEEVVNSPWFKRTSIIMFLTGMNEFRAKLQEVPLSEYFPEYTGGTDASEGAGCILARFLELNRFALPIYIFVNEVSDETSVRQLATAVQDTAIGNIFRGLDIL